MRARLFWILFFASAFGLLEAAVVVYLRELYYPEGFSFPLRVLPFRILAVELAREACSLAMLASAAWLAGRNRMSRFACLMLAFGAWDIVYYVGLYLFLGWPKSLLDWDILFLVPPVWVGPVLAPLLVSASLIAAGAVILWREDAGRPLRLSAFDWGLLASGGGAVAAAMLWRGSEVLHEAVPAEFPWLLLALGTGLGLAGLLRALRAR